MFDDDDFALVAVAVDPPDHNDDRHPIARVLAAAVIVVGILALLFAGSGCGPKAIDVHARVASSIALTADAIEPQLVADYLSEKRLAVDSSSSREDAMRRQLAVHDRWTPVAEAWEALTAAQGAWVSLLTRERAGEPVDAATALSVAGQVRTAWCNLRKALPPTSSLPDVPGAGCQ